MRKLCMYWDKTTSLDRINFGREYWFPNPGWSKLRGTHEEGGGRGRLDASPLVTICVSWAALLRSSLEEKLFLVDKTLPGNFTWFLLSDHYIYCFSLQIRLLQSTGDYFYIWKKKCKKLAISRKQMQPHSLIECHLVNRTVTEHRD